MTCFFVTGMLIRVIRIVERMIEIARKEIFAGSGPRDDTPR